MTIDEIKKLIQNGEKIDVEFKESKNALTKDVFDTVCSFNNRNGGHILLGINDKRDIVGVSEDRVDKVMKEFITSINNPQKIYPPLYLLPEVFEIDSKKIIYTSDTNTIEPFLQELENAEELYIDLSRYGGEVHLKFDDIRPKLIEISKKGTKVIPMHLDDAKYIEEKIASHT